MFGHEAEWVDPVYCMVCVRARSVAIVLLQSLEELGSGSPGGNRRSDEAVTGNSQHGCNGPVVLDKPERLPRQVTCWVRVQRVAGVGDPGFSTASHSLLLGTPVHRGPDQRSCVVGSWRTGRTQRVAGNGRFSHWQPVTSGCPGGDIGPNTV